MIFLLWFINLYLSVKATFLFVHFSFSFSWKFSLINLYRKNEGPFSTLWPLSYRFNIFFYKFYNLFLTRVLEINQFFQSTFWSTLWHLYGTSYWRSSFPCPKFFSAFQGIFLMILGIPFPKAWHEGQISKPLSFVILPFLSNIVLISFWWFYNNSCGHLLFIL